MNIHANNVTGNNNASRLIDYREPIVFFFFTRVTK